MPKNRVREKNILGKKEKSENFAKSHDENL